VNDTIRVSCSEASWASWPDQEMAVELGRRSGASAPTGLLVMHSCDNRRCCRPDHAIERDLLGRTAKAVLRGDVIERARDEFRRRLALPRDDGKRRRRLEQRRERLSQLFALGRPHGGRGSEIGSGSRVACSRRRVLPVGHAWCELWSLVASQEMARPTLSIIAGNRSAPLRAPAYPA
jgi:hypothetical protein